MRPAAEADGVRRLGSGDEPDRADSGVEELLEPCAGHVLEARAAGASVPLNAFWSQPVASRSAMRAASS